MFLAIRHRLLTIVFLLIASFSVAQVNLTQSNLPIVIINTDVDASTGLPAEIPDDPKVPASMKIIYHTDGSTNYITDQNTPEFLDYNGRIKIEIRGSTSQALPKKQYGWTTYEDNTTTKKKVSIMGMPKENDWILNGLAYDSSLIRDYISYTLFRQMGGYATRTQYCEVVINGVYNGLYILQEKIKDDSNRVNVEKIIETAATGTALTGGYITKADKIDVDDPLAWWMESYTGYPVSFIHVLPKPEDVTTAQQLYISNEFNRLAETSQAGNADFATGYPSIIDIPTFVDFMIINELSANVDAYQFSTYFHKDIGGKLRAGPVWDFNFSFGSDLADRSTADQWQFSNGDNEGAKFWKDLFNEPTFRCHFARRWRELTHEGQPLHYASLNALINQTMLLISDAAVREQETWTTVPDFAGEVNALKYWLLMRMNWINGNIGSYQDCANPVLPPLVISGINYHPATDAQYTISEDLEFIKITNTGTADVDLTGIYLRELGVSFGFQAGSVLGAGQSAYLANNAGVFSQKYGFAAFGEFQRDLSNSSQNIVLADAFGNIIDSVHYQDKNPWPDADGNGKYLSLVQDASDNSIAVSWEAVDDTTLATESHQVLAAVTVYPNPAADVLNVRAGEIINTYEVYNIQGALILKGTVASSAFSLNINGLASGVYLLKLMNTNGAVSHKIIKQ